MSLDGEDPAGRLGGKHVSPVSPSVAIGHAVAGLDANAIADVQASVRRRLFDAVTALAPAAAVPPTVGARTCATPGRRVRALANRVIPAR